MCGSRDPRAVHHISDTSGKDGVLFSGIPVGEVIEDQIEKRVEVRLFSDPDQIFLINVVLEKSTDLEAM